MIPFEVAFAIMAAVTEGSVINLGETTLRLDMSDLIRGMRLIKHGDDENHEGESVWDHSKLVYEQLGLSVDHPSLIERTGAWAAVIHDVGKLWTRGYDEKKEKVTFYKHGNYSAEVAKLFLQRIEKVPQGMGLISEDRSLVNMVKWHDAIISLQHDRKDDFSHMKKIYPVFESVAVRKAFLSLVRADCQPKAVEKKAKWAEDFSNDFTMYEAAVLAEENERNLRGIREVQAFKEAKPAIAHLLGHLGPEAIAIVSNAETPKDIGRLFGELGKNKQQDIIKKVKALYEVN